MASESMWASDRDMLSAECARLTAERDAARAEAEGLRADLLAHPPEHAARIAELEATIETLREDGKNCEAEYVAQRDEIMDMQRNAITTTLRYYSSRDAVDAAAHIDQAFHRSKPVAVTQMDTKTPNSPVKVTHKVTPL